MQDAVIRKHVEFHGGVLTLQNDEADPRICLHWASASKTCPGRLVNLFKAVGSNVPLRVVMQLTPSLIKWMCFSYSEHVKILENQQTLLHTKGKLYCFFTYEFKLSIYPVNSFVEQEENFHGFVFWTTEDEAAMIKASALLQVLLPVPSCDPFKLMYR
jgi:hypothetical protein